jgi:hypothetical protein
MKSSALLSLSRYKLIPPDSLAPYFVVFYLFFVVNDLLKNQTKQDLG